MTANNPEKNANPQLLMKTTEGDIKIELFADKAPQTVINFLKYVDSGHYENTIFHRVIENFMIQGGGMTKDMKQKSTLAPVQNEAENGLANKRDSGDGEDWGSSQCDSPIFY